MNFDYNELLRKQLYTLQEKLGLSEYNFVVDSEQAFVKYDNLKENTIYVLTRKLQNDIQFGVDAQPVQILILSENNSLDVAKTFFGEFARTYNRQVYSNEDIWVKQQYTDPVVLSNFNTINFGYRTVLYISVQLYIMEDVVDLKDLKIDNVKYTVLTRDLSYSMTPNTQQMSQAGDFISKSVKSVSGLSISITLPVISSALITKVLNIIDENDDESTDLSDSQSFGGNENFYFDFYLGDYHFENKKMKLIACNIGTAVNNIPAIRLGFTL